jgi:hypothetical protein
MIRNFNFRNNQRFDISHLKMIESSITDDLQVLTDDIIAGNSTIIIRGFTIPVTDIIGNPATSLQMITADSVMIHPLGSEEGGLFTVPASQSPDTLNSANPRVIGAFVPSVTNYISIGLVRRIDATTTETISILDDSTKTEFSQKVPLGDVLDYRIYIQTANFDSTSNICPVAIIRLGTNCEVISISDARPLAFRLGVGGTSPSATTPYYSLPDRVENPITFKGTGLSPFTGGDKSLSSFRDWMAVVERRIWEGNGGAYWYSPSSVNDVRPAYDSNSIFSEVSENWYLDGVDLLWQGIRFIFSNGTNNSYYCTVADQTTALVGLTNLNNGECLYIDIDRTRNAVNLPVTKANFAAMPQPTIPGSRLIIAWKNFGIVYVYGQSAPVNSKILHASPFVLGLVKIFEFPTGVTEPTCPTVDSSGRVLGTGLEVSGAAYQTLSIGTTINDNSIIIGQNGLDSSPQEANTIVHGTLRAGLITGGDQAHGSLSISTTTSQHPGMLYFGSSGNTYFNQRFEFDRGIGLTVSRIRGSTEPGGSLTLVSTPSENKNRISFGEYGVYYSDIDQEYGSFYVRTAAGGINNGNSLTLLSTSNETKGRINFGFPGQEFVESGTNYPMHFDEVTSVLQVPKLGIPVENEVAPVLISTSDATKGLIRFGAAGNSVYNETFERIGIGTESPSETLDIVGNASISSGLYVNGSLSAQNIVLPSLDQDQFLRVDTFGSICTEFAPILMTLDANISRGTTHEVFNCPARDSWGSPYSYFVANILVNCYSPCMVTVELYKVINGAPTLINHHRFNFSLLTPQTICYSGYIYVQDALRLSVTSNVTNNIEILHESTNGANDNTTNMIVYPL